MTTTASGRRLGYARVSRLDQNPDAQLDALRADGCARVWVEKASGATTARPELGQLLDRLEVGDVLVVWKLDRLARSTRDLLAIVDGLRERGAGLRSLTEIIDTTSAGGAFIMTVFAALAELERDLIRERTHAGLTAARSRGRVGGRPSVVTAERLEVMRDLASAGRSVAEISRVVGVSRATVYRHLDSSPEQLVSRS